MNIRMLVFLLFQSCAGLRVSRSDDGSMPSAPEWFTLYGKCASLQETWHDRSHHYWYGGREYDGWHEMSLGWRTRNEDQCQSEGVAEEVWESALSHIDGVQIKSQSFLASADEQVMAWTQGKQFQSLHFIGDSVCYQQFRSLRCILEAAGWSRMRVNVADATLEELWSRGGRSIQVSMSWRAHLHEVQELLSTRLRNASQPSDVITVVGVHAHYNGLSMWHNELQAFKAWVQNNNASVVLRGPLPQHFQNSADGTWRGTQCTANSNSSDWRLSAFQEVIGTSMPVVQVFDIALPMYFAHARSEVDCTHYCVPVHHVMNAALATLLSQ